MKPKLLLLTGLLCCALWSLAQTTLKIHHTFYDLYYYPKVCSSIMGYYVQTAEHTRDLQDIDRLVFKPDPLSPGTCPTDLKEEYKNYNAPFRTGPHTRDLHRAVDQGHINPYKAFTFSAEAADETMLFTNVCPQIAYVNEHQWNRVEQEVIKRSRQYGDVQVWTGVLISLSHPRMAGAMYQPDWYWKVIVYRKDGRDVEEAWLSRNVSENTETKASQAVRDVRYIRDLIRQYYTTFEPGFPLLN